MTGGGGGVHSVISVTSGNIYSYTIKVIKATTQCVCVSVFVPKKKHNARKLLLAFHTKPGTCVGPMTAMTEQVASNQ